MDLQFIFNRHEAKYPLGAESWDVALGSIERYLPIERFDGVHGLVNIRTIYLDTRDLMSYREFCDAQPFRRKVRIRQYGYDGRFDGQCWFEIKIKRFDESLKRRFACGLEAACRFLEGADILDDVRTSNGGENGALAVYAATREYVHHLSLRPVVRVDYERVAFGQASACGARITVDRNINFRVDHGNKIASYPDVLFEAKYVEEPPSWFDDLAEVLSLPNSQRFSKYAQAVERLMFNGHSSRVSA